MLLNERVRYAKYVTFMREEGIRTYVVLEHIFINNIERA